MDKQKYQDWICSHTDRKYTIERKNENEITAETEYASGRVIFHEQDIIELMIEKKENKETVFYLHFQLKDEEHAKNLFNEMLETLVHQNETAGVKVLLTCSSALTTSYYAQELNKAAETLKLDYSFTAVSYGRLFEKGFDYDVILLAPQIHFEYPKVKEIFRRKIVLKIPASIFAQYSTGGLIELIMQEKAEAEHQAEEQKNAKITDPFENEYRILALCLINHKNMYRFGYRLYDHGKRTLDKEVIKQTFGPSDIEDLMDYIVTLEKDIDAISVAVPGVTYNGTVDLPDYGFISRQIGAAVTEKYGIPVILLNDVNALALGYNAFHHDENMLFLFQPRGFAGPGAGLIINDQLYTGRKHAAGELVGFIHKYVENADERIFLPEGAMEVVGTALLAFISTMAPEKIILYSELTPNPEEIRSYIAQYIDPKYIPEITMVTHLKMYMLPGAMIHCLEEFQKHPEQIASAAENRGRES